jgi:hypothetical protein
MARGLDRSLVHFSRKGCDRTPRTRCDDEALPLSATGLPAGRRLADAPDAERDRAPRRAGRMLASRHVPDRSASVLRADRVLDARSGHSIRSASVPLRSAPMLGSVLLGTISRAGRACRGHRRANRYLGLVSGDAGFGPDRNVLPPRGNERPSADTPVDRRVPPTAPPPIRLISKPIVARGTAYGPGPSSAGPRAPSVAGVLCASQPRAWR